MRYFSAIISLFGLSILAIICLLYFGNITRNIEKENYILQEKISNIKDQININEVEFSLYNSYEYLQKMQKSLLVKVSFTPFLIIVHIPHCLMIARSQCRIFY